MSLNKIKYFLVIFLIIISFQNYAQDINVFGEMTKMIDSNNLNKMMEKFKEGIDPDIKGEIITEVFGNYNSKTTGTLLMYAVINGNEEAVRILLEAGADPNYPTYSGTAIVFAADRGYIEIIKILLDFGADINYDYNGHGPSATFKAIENLNFELLNFLINNGASPLTGSTANSENALTWMLTMNYPFKNEEHKNNVIRMLDKLIDYGLSIDDENAYSNALYLFVVEYNDTEMVKILLERGASPYCEYPYISSSDYGNEGFEIMKYVRDNHLYEIEKLLEYYRNNKLFK